MTGPLCLVTGWARGANALRPLADALGPDLAGDICAPDTLLAEGRAIQKARPAACSPYASALLARLERQKQPAIVAGWSMGGIIALEAATLAPERLSGLAMIGSTSRFTATDDYACGQDPALVRAMQHALRRDPRGTLTEFFSLVYAPQTPLPEQIEANLREALTIEASSLQHGLDYLGTIDLRGRIATLPTSIGLFHGDADQIIPHAASRFIAGEATSGVLQLLEGRGHALPVAQTSELAEALRNWISRF
ncbi:MAG: alpha/beta fold hydrolase [Verrucomicrobia bacterium]|nr:alpha/beta fold hydrolase [Verrucomicrobiota bacterium]